MNETVNDNVDWPGGRVMAGAVHDNMFPGLDFGLATWATEAGVGEELLVVFANGSMTCGHTGEACAQGISKAYDWEPGFPLGV